jgi:hypothetical protein
VFRATIPLSIGLDDIRAQSTLEARTAIARRQYRNIGLPSMSRTFGR